MQGRIKNIPDKNLKVPQSRANRQKVAALWEKLFLFDKRSVTIIANSIV